MTESGSGQPLEEIIPGANAKYYWTGSSWETDYLHGNHLGSTQLVTRADSSNSYAQAENMYAFGRVRWSGGGTQDIRYAGMQERDAETLGWQDSLDWTPNRLFSENMGRWLSPDPLAGDITNPQSLNRYSYVMNNPLNATDPLGLGQKAGGDPCANHPYKAVCGGDAASSAAACLQAGLTPNCAGPFGSGELEAGEAQYRSEERR